MRTRTKITLFGLLALAAAAVVTTAALLQRGYSAKEKPSALEEFVALRMRGLATPRGARELKSPVPASPEVLAFGRAHFADHCASCHANNGSGQTQMGQNLYPKAPDMRLARTQSLSDGELFYIIENGIRLTGMPAWGTGTPEGKEASWHLVHFIRRLPDLTEQELEEMEALNPKSPAELREEREIREFLEGGDADTPKGEKTEPPRRHAHRENITKTKG